MNQVKKLHRKFGSLLEKLDRTKITFEGKNIAVPSSDRGIYKTEKSEAQEKSSFSKNPTNLSISQRKEQKGPSLASQTNTKAHNSQIQKSRKQNENMNSLQTLQSFKTMEIIKRKKSMPPSQKLKNKETKQSNRRLKTEEAEDEEGGNLHGKSAYVNGEKIKSWNNSSSPWSSSSPESPDSHGTSGSDKTQEQYLLPSPNTNKGLCNNKYKYAKQNHFESANAINAKGKKFFLQNKTNIEKYMENMGRSLQRSGKSPLFPLSPNASAHTHTTRFTSSQNNTERILKNKEERKDKEKEREKEKEERKLNEDAYQVPLTTTNLKDLIKQAHECIKNEKNKEKQKEKENQKLSASKSQSISNMNPNLTGVSSYASSSSLNRNQSSKSHNLNINLHNTRNPINLKARSAYTSKSDKTQRKSFCSSGGSSRKASDGICIISKNNLSSRTSRTNFITPSKPNLKLSAKKSVQHNTKYGLDKKTNPREKDVIGTRGNLSHWQSQIHSENESLHSVHSVHSVHSIHSGYQNELTSQSQYLNNSPFFKKGSAISISSSKQGQCNHPTNANPIQLQIDLRSEIQKNRTQLAKNTFHKYTK